MTIKYCAGCGKAFQPRPQAKKQSYCSAAACQRIRKLQWQQNKLQSDPDYRDNQRAAQRAWQESHPDYWRQYRMAHPEFAERRKDRQPRMQISNTDSAKMDACAAPVKWAPGLYLIVPAKGACDSVAGALLVEITPVCVDCRCKKDLCKEMTR